MQNQRAQQQGDDRNQQRQRGDFAGGVAGKQAAPAGIAAQAGQIAEKGDADPAAPSHAADLRGDAVKPVQRPGGERKSRQGNDIAPQHQRQRLHAADFLHQQIARRPGQRGREREQHAGHRQFAPILADSD